MAHAVTTFERDRVERHRRIREKQLAIEQEKRTMEILNERRKERQEKDYHTMLKDIAEEKDFKFAKLDEERQ